MISIAGMATIRPLFEVLFFMSNEIFSETLRTFENVLLFAFLFYIALIIGVTRALSQGGKHS